MTAFQPPVDIETAGYAGQDYCSVAYPAVVTSVGSGGMQFNVSIRSRLSYGYCGQDYCSADYSDVFPNGVASLKHQVYVQPQQNFHQQWVTSIAKQTAYGNQFLLNIAARSPKAHQYQTVIAREQVFRHQYTASIARTQLTGQQYLTRIARNQATGQQYLAIISTRQAIANEWTTSIANTNAIHTQWTTSIAKTLNVGQQYNLRVSTTTAIPNQYSLGVSRTQKFFNQFETDIRQAPKAGHQYTVRISTTSAVYNQYSVNVARTQKWFQQYGLEVPRQKKFFHQVKLQFPQRKTVHVQYNYDSPYFIFEPSGYAGQDYPGIGSWPFTSDSLAKAVRNQWAMTISTNKAGNNKKIHNQFDIRPNALRVLAHNQIKIVPLKKVSVRQQYTFYNVDDLSQAQQSLHQQIDIAIKKAIHHSLRIAVYNTTNFRVLWQFASDGKEFNNIQSSTQASASFRIQNLKSDFVEQVWRSTGCEQEYIQVDVGEGFVSYFDTIAFIAHNLTGGADVKVYGYGDRYDNAPSTVIWNAQPVYAQMAMPNGSESNLIWLAPTQPVQAFRHWRIVIKDPSNPDGFIQAGRFVAGASTVFVGENYEADIDFQEVNYKDEVKPNGFTGVANNRALKDQLRLKFSNLNMAINASNYRQIKDYTRYCRDTLKALVIPDPQLPYQYTVFAKLKEMPAENHRYVDAESRFANMTLFWDEAL